MDEQNPVQAAARMISVGSWFALATIEPDGSPTLSHMPFAITGSAFGIVVSGLAAHTANLLARRPATIMLVDEGASAQDAYARPRLSIAVAPKLATSGSAEADGIWSQLASRHGETVAVLRTLSDFAAFKLEPIAARLVLGFAAAHNLDAAQIAAAICESQQSRS